MARLLLVTLLAMIVSATPLAAQSLSVTATYKVENQAGSAVGTAAFDAFGYWSADIPNGVAGGEYLKIGEGSYIWWNGTAEGTITWNSDAGKWYWTEFVSGQTGWMEEET